MRSVPVIFSEFISIVTIALRFSGGVASWGGGDDQGITRITFGRNLKPTCTIKTIIASIQLATCTAYSGNTWLQTFTLHYINL